MSKIYNKWLTPGGNSGDSEFGSGLHDLVFNRDKSVKSNSDTSDALSYIARVMSQTMGVKMDQLMEAVQQEPQALDNMKENLVKRLKETEEPKEPAKSRYEILMEDVDESQT